MSDFKKSKNSKLSVERPRDYTISLNFSFFLPLKNSNSNGIEFSSILDKISVKFSISASFFFGHCFFHLRSDQF